MSEIKTNVCEFCSMRFTEDNPDVATWDGAAYHYHYGCLNPLCILEIMYTGDRYEVIYIVHHPDDKQTPYYAERFENGQLRDIIATDTVKDTYHHARSMVRGARRYRGFVKADGTVA